LRVAKRVGKNGKEGGVLVILRKSHPGGGNSTQRQESLPRDAKLTNKMKRGNS
jgi:hypothetical protein